MWHSETDDQHSNADARRRLEVSIQRLVRRILRTGRAVTRFEQRILSEAGCRAVFDEQTDGRDLVLKVPLRFGMGYALLPRQSPRELAFWGGWGGSSVVVAPQSRMCIAYVMNRMEPSLLGDDRGVSLNRAALSAMDGR